MLSIIYLTYRAEPKFEWFVDSLWNQYQDLVKKHPKLKLELIFIDGVLRSTDLNVIKERRAQLKKVLEKKFNSARIVHESPKPSSFQGPHRLTPIDYFVAASCRNTGACYATQPYIIFADDLSILMPKWLSRAVKASEAKYVVAGAYKKTHRMKIDKGQLISADTPDNGLDSRWNLGSDTELVKISGGQLFGCSFGLPLELYLSLNGQNELCDSLGGEDYEFGLRLDQHGNQIFYDRRMLTYEAADLNDSHNSVIQRVDPRVTRSEYLQALKKFGVIKSDNQARFDIYDSSHFLIEMAGAKPNLWEAQSPILNGYQINLRQLRDDILHSKPFPINNLPKEHFLTRQPLSELTRIDEVLAQISEIVPKLEGWCTVEKAVRIARLIFQNQLRNCVELGVFAGRSMIPIALTVNHCYPKGRLHAIDPWKKQAALEGTNDPANDEWWAKLDYEHWYQYTCDKIVKYGVGSVVQVMRMTSQEAVDLFTDGSLDFLHQDANHSEETSTAEVKRWSSKVRSGGYWIFDDTNWATTKKAQKMLVSDYGFKEISDHETWKIYKKL